MRGAENTMSPSDLEVLIHCHAIPGPHPRFDSGAIQDTLDQFCADGIIERVANTLDEYRTTDRGQKWLEMILETPYPEQCWIDPRLESTR
jgi:DNA-binding PadR family transcriptional regulator